MNATQDYGGKAYIVALTMVSGSFNMALGLPLNSYVIWLILTNRTLDTDIYSLNLALSEIFICLSSVWYFAYQHTNLSLCLQVYIFSNGIVFTARPLFQCCISVECYVGVLHPVFFLKCKPLRYRTALCCIAWLAVLTSCIYSMFTFFTPPYHYGFFVQNLLFMSVILFCCLSVLKALKHPGPGEKDASNKKTSNKAKRRAFKIIFVIMISMFINSFLYICAIPLQGCFKSTYFDVLNICLGLALATAVVQPILYLHRSGKCICIRRF